MPKPTGKRLCQICFAEEPAQDIPIDRVAVALIQRALEGRKKGSMPVSVKSSPAIAAAS